MTPPKPICKTDAWLAEMSQVWIDQATTGTGFMFDGKRVAPEDVYAPLCKTCNGCGWICDNSDHEDRPWGDHPRSGPNGCHCGGAGKPCPVCNLLSRERR